MRNGEETERTDRRKRNTAKDGKETNDRSRDKHERRK
jgi:hypothetical protein